MALVFGLLVGVFAILASAFIFPVEWNEAKSRFRFWRAGARPLLWEKHRGFQLDRCAGNLPEKCPCIWFVHGLGDSVATWRRFFVDPELWAGKPVRLFAVDLPGHGGSLRRRNPEEYRVSRMAFEMDQQIAEETRSSARVRIGRGANPRCVDNVLVGNSFGGWVATLMALRTPELYRSLVLVGSSGTVAAEEASRDLFREPTVESLREFQSRAYFRPRALSDAEWKFAVGRLKRSGISEIREAQVSEDRLDGRLHELTVATTLIWGEADRVLPRRAMDPFTKNVSGILFRTLAECGHLPQKECPEKLAAAMRDAIP